MAHSNIEDVGIEIVVLTEFFLHHTRDAYYLPLTRVKLVQSSDRAGSTQILERSIQNCRASSNRVCAPQAHYSIMR